MKEKSMDDYLDEVVRSLQDTLTKQDGVTKNPIRSSMVELKEDTSDAE